MTLPLPGFGCKIPFNQFSEVWELDGIPNNLASYFANYAVILYVHRKGRQKLRMTRKHTAPYFNEPVYILSDFLQPQRGRA